MAIVSYNMDNSRFWLARSEGTRPKAAEGRPGKEQGKDVKTEVESDGTGPRRECHGAHRLAAAAGLPARGEGREPRPSCRRQGIAPGFPEPEPVRQLPPSLARRLDRGGKIKDEP